MQMPAVSVIIPLYNAEKYIGECLDSILAQTFQDFEVIVVDDCSTDSSAQVVESYMPKFDGRLRLERTLANSGSPGLPGNMGVRFSRGEYLLILDNDDAITPDAIEKLYTTAKDFDADVVACEKYYQVPTQFFNDAEVLAKIQPYSYQRGGFVDKPTLIEFDVAKRVVDCTQKRFLWNI
ncbi:MAG: glycosyltransferase family 2 protein [Selenomonadaceae bacterium]|nr:glycosyltransferase family 2 protein [Selenomonadaceae bacterium]